MIIVTINLIEAER